jgi:hypothetical protein
MVVPPTALPIDTAPVPPVPICVAAAPAVLMVVAPVNEIGPGVTVKDAKIPAPPPAATSTHVATFAITLANMNTELVVTLDHMVVIWA